MSDQEKIQELESKLAQKDALLTKALTEIAQLKALLLDLALKKTSKNSHLPPSVDLTRKNQSLRGKSDKPVGGQKGHKGTTLKMSETPDEIQQLYPSFCSVCGQDLKDFSFDLSSKRQVTDIPPIVPFITEYQCLKTTCTCGKTECGSFPEGVKAPTQYGTNVQSLVVYQSYYQFMPFERLQDFFKKICNLSISKGTIENIIRRTAAKASPIYETIKEYIQNSAYVGADETSFKCNGTKQWFWVWQNARLTYLVAANTRSKAVIKEEFPEGLPNSIVGSDRLAAQLSTTSKGKQICLAHLLRDCNYLIDCEQNEWATQFKTLLQDAIILKQLAPSYSKKDEKVLEIELKANDLLENARFDTLLKEPEKYKKTITFFKGMSHCREALFTFLYHKEVPFHNNGSERAFRMVKVKAKISGQFKSLQNEFAMLRSVIDTAIKNGQSVFNAIKALVLYFPCVNVAG
jgi:transposase